MHENKLMLMADNHRAILWIPEFGRHIQISLAIHFGPAIVNECRPCLPATVDEVLDGVELFTAIGSTSTPKAEYPAFANEIKL